MRTCINYSLVLAWRKHYLASGSQDFLRSIWDPLYNTCIFWECRFVRVDDADVSSPTSTPDKLGRTWNSGCSPKNENATGSWTVRNVMTPDEAAGVINDSAYTNAAAGKALEFCISVGGILKEEVPYTWADIASNIYLPLTVDNDGNTIHQEYTDFDKHFHRINQADVALMQFPLGLEFDEVCSNFSFITWLLLSLHL
jgi:hypothetical protein